MIGKQANRKTIQSEISNGFVWTCGNAISAHVDIVTMVETRMVFCNPSFLTSLGPKTMIDMNEETGRAENHIPITDGGCSKMVDMVME